MKVSDDVKIKENLKRYETSNAVETAVDMVLSIDVNGNINYNPAFIDFAKFYAVVMYLVDGVEFEDDDTYETIQSNEKLNAIVNSFIGEFDIYGDDENEATKFWELGCHFVKDVEDLLRFRKQLYLDNRNEVLREEAKKAFTSATTMNQLLTKLAEENIKLIKKQLDIAEKNDAIAASMTPEEIAEMNRMLLSGKLNLDDLAENTARRFVQESLSDERVNDIVMAKNEQIRQLKEHIADMEKERQSKIDD